MKRALLCVSLAANAALAWMFFGAGSPAAPASSTTAAESIPAGKPNASSAVAALAADASTPESLRDALRRLGFSEADVRRALRAQIEAPRLAREREFRTAARNSGSFWQDTWGSRGRLPNVQRDELQAMRQAERAELTRLFGAEALLQPGELDALAFLPPDQARRVALVEHDLADQRRELEARTGADALPLGEREKIIAAARDRALADVLSPEERTLLAMRDSETARRIRNRFEFFQGNEAEYRALFALQHGFDEKHGQPSGLSLSNVSRTPAGQQLADDLRAALGPGRTAEWQATQRPENQALAEVQRRENVPAAAVAAVRQIPARTSEAALRIAADATLDSEQKIAALRDLAARARADVRGVLGSELGDAYNAASARGWLDYLDRGATYAFTADGGVTTQPVGARPPPARK